VTAALALVDDADAVDAADDVSPTLAPRYRAPHGARDDTDAAVDLDAAPDLIDVGWSAEFVHHVGYGSHFDRGLGTSVWPLPATSRCNELAAFGASHFALAADAPQPGDIYLLWSPAKKCFVRAGIVFDGVRPFSYPSGRTGYECLTIDGDTTQHGSVRGPYTALIQRVLSADAGDRLIRWPLLELTTCVEPSPVECPYRRAA
jgi:hypothetical protein